MVRRQVPIIVRGGNHAEHRVQKSAFAGGAICRIVRIAAINDFELLVGQCDGWLLSRSEFGEGRDQPGAPSGIPVRIPERKRVRTRG